MLLMYSDSLSLLEHFSEYLFSDKALKLKNNT